MRTVHHDTTAILRINGALLAAAQDKARKDGVSLSELFRRGVRNQVQEAA